MSWLFEQPAVPLFSGALLLAIAAAIWVQTRSGCALAGCLAIAAFTAAWLVIQQLVVTEPEQIKETIQSIAALVEDNEVERVVSYLSSTNPEMVEEVRTLLQAVQIEKVTIKRNFKATVTRHNGLVSGEARFNAVATATDRRGLWGPQPVPRFVIVQMRKEGELWKVRGYELQDPREGLRQ